MEKTVCELFAGVGGFRCGLNAITQLKDTKKKEKWKKKLLVEKQKVEWLKWIMVASCVLFCVFYARK